MSIMGIMIARICMYYDDAVKFWRARAKSVVTTFVSIITWISWVGPLLLQIVYDENPQVIIEFYEAIRNGELTKNVLFTFLASASYTLWRHWIRVLFFVLVPKMFEKKKQTSTS